MPRHTVNAVKKSIDIFDYLSDNGPSGVTEIGEALGLGKSSVHKHLKTLRHGGLVTKFGNEYKISYRILRYTKGLEACELISLAEATITDLAEQTDELVVFAIKEETKGVFIYSANDRFGFTNSLPGKTFFLHQNSAGKSILARCSDDEIQEVIDQEGLPRKTENTITDTDELHREIDRIRRRGYAINDQERNEFRSVGTGITDPNTGITGAFTIGGPPKRMSISVLTDQYADILLGAVNDLEIQLKYGP